MRAYQSVALLGGLFLAGCNTLPVSNVGPKFALAGKPLKVDTQYSLNPDCTSIGTTTIRTIEPPRHGTVEVREASDFPFFKPENTRSQCNSRRVPVSQIIYTPAPGYSGPDSFRMEVIYPSGGGRDISYKIEVR
jgi:hypothetical protein